MTNINTMKALTMSLEESNFIKKLQKFLNNSHKIAKIIGDYLYSDEDIEVSKDSKKLSKEEYQDFLKNLTLYSFDNTPAKLLKDLEKYFPVDFSVHLHALYLFSNVIHQLKSFREIKETKNVIYLVCFILSQKLWLDVPFNLNGFADKFQIDNKELFKIETFVFSNFLTFQLKSKKKFIKTSQDWLKNMNKLVESYKIWREEKLKK